ncbi:MAG: HDOD domain-containing protein [Bacteroidales bacterium]|nr:HDOD domain-containing protein [Candidatus Latescibacterota bacterium]
MSDVFVGRQPIYNRKLKVIGYELLYRHRGDAQTAQFSDGESAVSNVIMNTFVDIGLENLVGRKLAFINFPRGFLTGEHPIPLPPAKVVIEVLEDIEVDDQVIESVRDLRDQGFKIALDDIVDPDGKEPLLDIAWVAKVDLRQIRAAELTGCVRKLRSHGVKILAEKIETMEEYEYCAKHGFDYYQGFFLEKPKIITGQSMPASTLMVMRLLARLQGKNVNFEEIGEIVKQDVSLSYMLLRLINSAYYTLPREIDSIQEALIMLGIEKIRSWLSILLLSRMEGHPEELIRIAMVRGKMCETLTRSIDVELGGTGFMVGLFSVLEAMLKRPMKDILELLPLGHNVKAAILDNEGVLGETLEYVLDYEHWNWENFEDSSFKAEKLNDAYLEALDWATEASSITGA